MTNKFVRNYNEVTECEVLMHYLVDKHKSVSNSLTLRYLTPSVYTPYIITP